MSDKIDKNISTADEKIYIKSQAAQKKKAKNTNNETTTVIQIQRKNLEIKSKNNKLELHLTFHVIKKNKMIIK